VVLKRKSKSSVNDLQSGQIEAFESVFRKYYAPLVVFARKYVDDYDTARDIVQDLFVKFYEKRAEINVEISLKSYLYRSVYNSCINYLNNASMRVRHAKTMESTNEIYNDLEDEIIAIDLQYKIYNIIDKLPNKCRKIFKMNRFEGLSNDEIAQSLNLSKRTVETQISKALKILRNKLAAYD